jgi:hypothetical protein
MEVRKLAVVVRHIPDVCNAGLRMGEDTEVGCKVAMAVAVVAFVGRLDIRLGDTGGVVARQAAAAVAAAACKGAPEVG